MLDTALMDALARRPPIWAAGAQDWWDFTRSGRAKRGVGAMPAETRARDGFAQNEAGVWVRRSANTRSMAGNGLLTYPGRTNQVKNPSAAGATDGVVGSGGAFPTGWSAGSNNFTSVTRTITQMTRNGLSGVAIRYQIVASGAGQTLFERFGGTADVAVPASTAHVLSCFTEVIAGDATDIRTYFNVPQFDASSVLTGEVFGTSIALVTAWTRQTWAWTTPASTVKAEPRIRFDVTAAGTYDFTVFVAWPQLEAGAFAGPPIADASATTTDTAAGPQQVIDIGSRAAGGIGLIIDVDVREIGSTLSRLFELNDGTGNNLFHAYMIQGSQTLVWQAIVGGALQAVSNCAIPTSGRMVVSAACSAGFMKVRCVGQAEAAAQAPPSYPALATKLAPLGRGYDEARNSYGYSKRLALWYGPMSAHFFDNVLWPKAQLLAQVA